MPCGSRRTCCRAPAAARNGSSTCCARRPAGRCATGAPESAASLPAPRARRAAGTAARAGVLRELGLSEAATGLPTAIARLEEALTAGVADRDRAHTLLDLGRARVLQRRARARRSPRSSAAASIVDADALVAAQARRRGDRARACSTPRSRGRVLRSRPAAAAPRTRPTPEQRRRCSRRAACARRWSATPARPCWRSRGGALSGGDAARRPGRRQRARRRLDGAARLRRAGVERPRADGRDGARARARVDDGVRDGEPAARGVALGAGAPRRGDGATPSRPIDAERYGWRQFLPAAYGIARQPAPRPRRARRRASDWADAGWTRRVRAARRCWRRGTRRSGGWRSLTRREADALAHFAAWRDAVAGVRNPASFAALALGRRRAR